VQSADASVREAELRWMPMITLGANARYTDTAGFAGENWLWAATANLVVPIFDRGVRYADARERRATRSRLNLELDKAERDLDAGLAVAREDLDNAKASLALAQQQAQRAKRTAAVVAAALAAGGATSLEVAEADTNLRQSEANAAREQITLDLAILRLQHLAGAIHAPDEN
jgi:outer membrane protein TolC